MAPKACSLFGDVAPFGVKKRFGFKSVATLCDKLRREFGNSRDELLAIMFNKIFRVSQNRLQMPVDCRDSAIDVRYQGLALGNAHLSELRERCITSLAEFLAY